MEETNYDDYDYEGDLEIDPDGLDVEWMKQPRLFMKYCRAARDADRKAKRAHEKLKTVRSECVKMANEDPDRYLGRGVKPTNPNVEAFYRTDGEYQAAKSLWIDAEHERDVLNDAVFAFQQRKGSLENLVRLLTMDYFKSPVEPRNLTEEARKKSTKDVAREKVKKSMKGKRATRTK